METEEIWRNIKDYEGYYQVSNLGNVRSVDRYIEHNNGQIHFRKSQLLKSQIGKYGYCYVVLSKNNHQKTKTNHRLVAETFIPNPKNKPEVNHKSRIKLENFVNNLEWVTSKENVQHSFNVGTRKVAKYWLGKHGNNHIKSKTVLQYDLSGNYLNDFGSTHEAKRLTGINQGHISEVCRGERKTAGGFTWEYVKI